MSGLHKLTSKVPPLAFGGWLDYDTWADHGFVVKPVAPEREPEPAPGRGDDVDPPDNDPDSDFEDGPAPDLDDDWAGGFAGDLDPDSPLSLVEEGFGVEHGAPAARPYVRVRGRTQPEYTLRLETLISSVARAPGKPAPALDSIYHLIHVLCRQPMSVAEIAARTGVPLAVARVLISDAIACRLLVAHHDLGSRRGPSGLPSPALLREVLDGLQRMS
jgi:hypothetical protein